MPDTKPITVHLVIAAGLVASLAGCGRPGGEVAVASAIPNGEPAVAVVAVTRDGAATAARLAGRLEPWESAALHTKVTGYLERLHAEIGDRVASGQTLAEVAAPEVEQALARARAALRRAEARAELGQATAARLAALAARAPGATTREQVEVAQTQAAVDAAEVEVARAAVTEAEAWLGYTTIRAPFDGVISERTSEIGALLAAGAVAGPAVYRIDRVDTLRLVVDVPEPLVASVRPGTPVAWAAGALPGRTWSGEISRIASSLDARTRSMRAEADVANRDGVLRPGLFATVELRLVAVADAVTLPADTVASANGQPYVLAVADGRLRKVAVTLLQDLGATVVVSGGLTAGDLVVARNVPGLAEGMAVAVVESKGGK